MAYKFKVRACTLTLQLMISIRHKWASIRHEWDIQLSTQFWCAARIWKRWMHAHHCRQNHWFRLKNSGAIQLRDWVLAVYMAGWSGSSDDYSHHPLTTHAMHSMRHRYDSAMRSAYKSAEVEHWYALSTFRIEHDLYTQWWLGKERIIWSISLRQLHLPPYGESPHHAPLCATDEINHFCSIGISAIMRWNRASICPIWAWFA